ncbi:DUF2637 domain-containing protein [Antrihabitans sp. YC2-6]|uniref:DUF2637 domain-containing protein n=1 Tax=Antrihabitans sp. YC2-6 TaxID=2799498 RepID=UPI0018F3E3C0|nr:DUF2637 domain-containing protein [Antrihabitans sp. YC2-6]MBJ8344511.1 DUF2637 domain-containing protein [Antrihabitans sp. YC2-6]
MTASRARPLHIATISAVGLTVAIATGAFVLSFAALSDLAVQAGQPRRLAWIWPVIVDGAILQSTISVVTLARFENAKPALRFFWMVLASTASVSVAGNAFHAGISSGRTLAPLVSAAVATVAPVSLLAATHGIALLIRITQHAEPMPSKKDHPIPGQPASRQRSPKSSKANDIRPPRRSKPSPTLSPVTASDQHASNDDPAGVAAALKAEGWSHRRIGVRLGVHHKTVGRMLQKRSQPAEATTPTEIRNISTADV